MRFIIKVLISSIFIGLSTEIAKRSNYLGALLISLPITSILALIWLYLDSHNTQQVQAFSMGIFWSVIPSLFLFASLPFFLKSGIRFEISLLLSCLGTFVSYVLFALILSKFNINI